MSPTTENEFTDSDRGRLRDTLWRGACLTLVFLLCGCLSRPYLKVQTYAFEPLTGSAPKPAVANRRVVAIRSLRVATPFESRSFVYRTGKFSYETDPYAEFLVSPSESLLFPIRAWMRETGAFETFVEAGGSHQPNTIAEITVLELYGDFRQPTEAAAEMKVRFVLFAASKGIAAELMLDREYSRRIPLKARSAEALMAGWNEALAQILGQFDSDLRMLESAS